MSDRGDRMRWKGRAGGGVLDRAKGRGWDRRNVETVKEKDRMGEVR